MRVKRQHTYRILGACLFVFGVAVWLRSTGNAQVGQRTAAAGSGVTFDFKGPDGCVACHREPTDQYKARGVDGFILLTESATWGKEDRHAMAFKVLSEARGKQMAKLLGYDVTKSQSCLSCHANWHLGLKMPNEFILRQGVSCESCHGASSGWFEEHMEEAFRKKSFEYKEGRGMVTVRDPVNRAEQCLSCHVGNAKEGKVLTHEMYAAGHPPLPGIEVETFSHRMPRHWQYVDERLANLNANAGIQNRETVQKDLEFMQQQLGYHAGDLYRTKSVILSGTVMYRQSVELFGDLMKQAHKQNEWPELAQFDCYMCHHDLQSPSWRQMRVQKGPPGRPQLPVWTAALVELGIRHAAQGNSQAAAKLQAEFDAKVAKLRRPIESSPFGIGEPKELAAASAELVSWLNEAVIAKLEKSAYPEKSATTALQNLARLGQQNYLDYDSARQIAWAFQTILEDLERLHPGHSVVTGLRAKLTAADKGISLETPAKQQTDYEDALEAAFKDRGGYDPEKVQQLFATLATQLGLKTAAPAVPPGSAAAKGPPATPVARPKPQP